MSIKLQGNLAVNSTLLIVMNLSSIGCLRASKLCFWNSLISSKNSIPLWASDISPGWGNFRPPPISELMEAVWWTSRNGRRFMRGWSLLKFPTTEKIFVVSRISSFDIGGRRLLTLFDNSVLPQPGLPLIRMLCLPATAILRARLAWCCPIIPSKGFSVF